MDTLVAGNWLPAKDGDARARALYQRHYSCHHYRDGRRPALFVGPGEKMVLLTLDCRAVWVWRKFKDDSGEQGVNNAVFRNEGLLRSSELIREACDLGWQRWPGERLYTYVDDDKVQSANPGYCFKQAGWRLCRDQDGRPRRTGSGKLILEMLPEWAG